MSWPDVGGEQLVPVSGQAGLGGVLGVQRVADGVGGGDREAGRQVHPAHGQAGVEGEPGGVADHDHAVRDDLADHVQAAFGDQVAAVLEQLAAVEVARR